MKIMNPKTVLQIFTLGIALLLLSLPGNTGQQGNDPFRDLEDDKILPMLRHLPRQHGGMNVPAPDGRFLYDLIVEKGYTRGLEIGTSNGYSGLWIGLALRHNGGNLITMEINPQAANEARGNFTKAGLDQVIEVRTADALEEIPKIPGTFDFIFIDAWKPDYYRYLQLVKDRVVSGGAITAHNVTSSQSQMRAFIEAIRSDPVLETRIYPVSGQGVSVSIVKSR
jgi:caffeoyl-CoA O-methyltransferase